MTHGVEGVYVAMARTENSRRQAFRVLHRREETREKRDVHAGPSPRWNPLVDFVEVWGWLEIGGVLETTLTRTIFQPLQRSTKSVRDGFSGEWIAEVNYKNDNAPEIGGVIWGAYLSKCGALLV